MRGADITQEPLFTTTKLDERVPHDHPLRSIKTLFDQALTHIDWKLSLIYSSGAFIESLAAANPLQYSQRTAAGRADSVQHALALVFRPEY
jgi:hypothetical protein